MVNSNFSRSPFSMKDLHALLGKLGPQDLILDVRGPEEYRSGHIQGSVNIPHDQVSHHADQLRSYEKIYIHCQAGKRAAMAAQALSQSGLTNLVCISGSGMGDWLAAGYPVST